MEQSTQDRSAKKHFVEPFRVSGKTVTTPIRPSIRLPNRSFRQVRNFVKAKLTCDYNQQRVCLDFSCGLITSTARHSIETKVYFPISSFINEGKTEEHVSTITKKVYTPKNAVLQGTYNEFSCDWERGGTLTTAFPSWLPMSAFSMSTTEVGNGTYMVSAQGRVEFTIERTDQATIQKEVLRTVTRPSAGTNLNRLTSSQSVSRPSSSTTISRPSSSSSVSRPSSGTVSRPNRGGTVSRPSSSPTVTRPSTSSTVTRPSTGSTVTRPSTETEKIKNQRTVSRRCRIPFSIRGNVDGDSVYRLSHNPVGSSNNSSLRDYCSIEASLSYDNNLQKFCLDIGYYAGGLKLKKMFYLPVSDIIKEIDQDEIGNNNSIKREHELLNVSLQGTYDRARGVYNYDNSFGDFNSYRPARSFERTRFELPDWLPVSEVMMKSNTQGGNELTAIDGIGVQGVAVFTVELEEILTEIRPVQQKADGENSEAKGKQLIPNYPIVLNENKLTSDSILICADKSRCVIPDVELKPFNGLLFRYEDVPDGEGGFGGKLGFVHLEYELKNPNSSYKALPVEIDHVRLNLKTSRGPIGIDGDVDTLTHKLNFNLKDEAVKVAFFNLISLSKANQCDVDVFLKFEGYEVEGGTNLIKARRFDREIGKEHIKKVAKKMTLTPQVIKPEKRFITRSISGQKEEPNYVESTFTVKVNKRLCYPLETLPGLFRHYYEIIQGNPFKLNDDFSEFKEIFCPDIDRDIVRVCKSLFSPNNFLLLPQKYYLARYGDQPCIASKMFFPEEGVSEEEKAISKINFSFTVAPALSEYDLANLKLILIENGMLDDELSSEETKQSPFDRIRFSFPNDIGTEATPSGDEFLAKADITQNGKYFNIICETEDLAEASLFITAMNSGFLRSFNITSKNKELTNSATVELDMDNTIGEFLNLKVENDEILAFNESNSPCHISNIVLLNKEGEAYYNDRYFEDKEDLGSQEKLTIKITDLTDDASFMQPKNVFAEYESIEDINKEFDQEIDQLTSYYQKVVLDLSNMYNDEVESIQIDVLHVSTGCVYRFFKERDQFDQPIQLTIITKYEKDPITQLQIMRTYYDQDENIIWQDDSQTLLEWDYSLGAWIDLSLEKQE